MKSPWAVAFILGLFGPVACEQAPKPERTSQQQDVDVSASSVKEEAAGDPADLRIAAKATPVAEPVSLKLVAPATFHLGRPARFVTQAVDAKGEPVVVELQDVRLSSEPTAKPGRSGELVFASEGNFEVRGQATLPNGKSIEGVLAITVDKTPPEVEILEPQAAAMLTLDKPVNVRIRVRDAISEVASVKLGDQVVALDDAGQGSIRLAPSYGLNILRVQAMDTAGNREDALRGFVAAQRFAPTTSGAGAGAVFDRGLQVFLGQAALDAGGHQHRNPRDLATVMELVLGGFQGSAITGQSFKVDRSGFDGKVTITGLRHGRANINHGYPELTLEAIRGGLELKSTFRNVQIQTKIDGKMLLTPIHLRADISARSMSVSATISIVMLATGKVLVKTRDVSVNLHGLDIELSGRLSSALNPILDVFKKRIASAVEKRLGNRLAGSIDGPLAIVLGNLAVNQSFTVPGVHGSWPTRLRLHSELGELLIDKATGGRKAGIEVGLKAGVTGPSRLARKIPGAPVRGNCHGAAAKPERLAGQRGFEVGLSLDFANQVLTSVWQGAGFRGVQLGLGDVSLAGGLYRLKNLDVSVDLGLPPLLTDCGRDGKLELQVGSVQATIKTELGGDKFEVDVVLHVAAKGSATGAVNPKTGIRELGLSVEPAHLLEFQVTGVKVNAKPAGRERAEFVESALGLVSGRLLDMFQGTLASVPMPELPLESLSPAVPRGASLRIDIREVAPAAGEIRATGVVR